VNTSRRYIAMMAAAAIALLAARPASAEVFETTDGRKLDGDFLSLRDGQVSIRYRGATVRLPLAELTPKSAYSARHQALGDSGTGAEYFALAEFAETHNLLTQALASFAAASRKDDTLADECRRRMDAIDEKLAEAIFNAALTAYRATDLDTAEAGFNRVVRDYPHTSKFGASRVLLVRIAEARAAGAGKPTPEPSPEPTASAAQPTPAPPAATPAPAPSPSVPLVTETESDKRIGQAFERANALEAEAARHLAEGNAEAAERHYPRARKALDLAEAAMQKARDYIDFALQAGSQPTRRAALERRDAMTVRHVEILEALTRLHLSVVSLNRATEAVTKALRLDAATVRLQ
jgi:tetratricopeptide (TPR) repeat protein